MDSAYYKACKTFVEKVTQRVNSGNLPDPPTVTGYPLFPHARAFLKWLIDNHEQSYDLVQELANMYTVGALAQTLDRALTLLRLVCGIKDPLPEWLEWREATKPWWGEVFLKEIPTHAWDYPNMIALSCGNCNHVFPWTRVQHDRRYFDGPRYCPMCKRSFCGPSA